MTSLVGVQCTETSLAFCPECFATGVEVVGYKANHGYDIGNFLPLNNNRSAKNSNFSESASGITHPSLVNKFNSIQVFL